MLPHQLPACTHVAHKDNPNTRQTLVSDNVNVAHGERDKPQSQMKIEGETSKMSRGMKKEDGKLQTRQATRQGTSGQGTSSQATSPHRCRPRKRCVKKAKDKLQNTTAYQQQRINNSVSTTAYQQGYSPRTRSLCASTLRRTPGAVFTEDAGSGDGERSENPPSAACLGGWSCRC
jgi:hypothetical protein